MRTRSFWRVSLTTTCVYQALRSAWAAGRGRRQPHAAGVHHRWPLCHDQLHDRSALPGFLFELLLLVKPSNKNPIKKFGKKFWEKSWVTLWVQILGEILGGILGEILGDILEEILGNWIVTFWVEFWLKVGVWILGEVHGDLGGVQWRALNCCGQLYCRELYCRTCMSEGKTIPSAILV